MEKKGVKELLELLEGVKAVGLTAKAIVKDGKVGLEDLPALMTLIQKQQVLVAAIEGVGEIGDELKDLSLDEAMVVITAIVDGAKEVKAA